MIYSINETSHNLVKLTSLNINLINSWGFRSIEIDFTFSNRGDYSILLSRAGYDYLEELTVIGDQ